MDSQPNLTSQPEPQPQAPNHTHSVYTVLVVLALLFFFPVGLVLMWFMMRTWPKWAKILITLIPLIFLLLGFISYTIITSNASKLEEAQVKQQQLR